jgi:hypothetical protein
MGDSYEELVKTQVREISEAIKGHKGRTLTEEDAAAICKSITDLGELSIETQNETSAKYDEIGKDISKLKKSLNAATHDKNVYLDQLIEAQFEIIELKLLHS